MKRLTMCAQIYLASVLWAAQQVLIMAVFGRIHYLITLAKSTHALIRQNLLYLYYLVYNLPDDGLVEAETCRRDIINDK